MVGWGAVLSCRCAALCCAVLCWCCAGAVLCWCCAVLCCAVLCAVLCCAAPPALQELTGLQGKPSLWTSILEPEDNSDDVEHFEDYPDSPPPASGAEAVQTQEVHEHGGHVSQHQSSKAHPGGDEEAADEEDEEEEDMGVDKSPSSSGQGRLQRPAGALQSSSEGYDMRKRYTVTNLPALCRVTSLLHKGISFCNYHSISLVHQAKRVDCVYDQSGVLFGSCFIHNKHSFELHIAKVLLKLVCRPCEYYSDFKHSGTVDGRLHVGR